MTHESWYIQYGANMRSKFYRWGLVLKVNFDSQILNHLEVKFLNSQFPNFDGRILHQLHRTGMLHTICTENLRKLYRGLGVLS